MTEAQEAATVAAAARMIKMKPWRCPVRLFAEVTFQLNPEIQRCELEEHVCKEKCPEVLERAMLNGEPP